MDLLKDIEKGKVFPVYFFCGAEKYLMEDALGRNSGEFRGHHTYFLTPDFRSHIIGAWQELQGPLHQAIRTT
jgi:DNA polymerase III delta subunit